MSTSTTHHVGTRGVARAEREAQIIDAAGRVFAERGYGGASVGEIAGAADISKPLIYQYFGSKEGLLVACLRHAAALIGDEIERTARAGAVGPARAVVTLDGVFRVLDGRRWPWRLLDDATLPPTPDVTEILHSHRERLDTFAAEGVGELMHLAGDDDPGDLAAMTAVWTSVLDALVTWWLDHPEETPESMSHRCLRLFTTLFGPIELPGD